MVDNAIKTLVYVKPYYYSKVQELHVKYESENQGFKFWLIPISSQQTFINCFSEVRHYVWCWVHSAP